ncbi:hypothetical protein ACN2CC_28135 [Mesorhizobium muleiense]|uniref:hypothetical protein n=1 Tax=Mesorhizobium muleiense TaxID=1004279 RepID=UPI003AFAB677
MAFTRAEKQARYRDRQKLKLPASAEGNVTDISLTIKSASVEWLETTRAMIDAELAGRGNVAGPKKRTRTEDHPNFGRF